MPQVLALAVVRHCVRRITPIALLVGGVAIAPLHFELSTGGLASSASLAKDSRARLVGAREQMGKIGTLLLSLLVGTIAYADEPPAVPADAWRPVEIPQGHLPPPGECRIWFLERPAGHQPPPERCEHLRGSVPPGAVLVSHEGVELYESVGEVSGLPCRTFRTTVVIDGRPETATGTACQEPDGTWRIVH
jgi:hypothetical protein